MTSVKINEIIRFADYELNPQTYRLSRAGNTLRLERIPTEILIFLIERKGELVTREKIAERIWGKDVFVDTDNSINGAIRKIRQALKGRCRTAPLYPDHHGAGLSLHRRHR